MLGRYIICDLGSFMIMGAYCVGKVQNMLPRLYYDKESILCRLGKQYVTSILL